MLQAEDTSQRDESPSRIHHESTKMRNWLVERGRQPNKQIKRNNNENTIAESVEASDKEKELLRRKN